jgi:acetyl-CoA synthetase
MADHKPTEYDDFLREDRSFPPPPAFRARAHVRDESLYAEGERDPEAFWATFARELEWSRPWDRVLD